jgi:outer membrane protein OmpA-like peptidoglycan-associated protein
VESQLSSTLIFTGGVRIYENEVITITPEVLFTRSTSNNVFNLGAITGYTLKPINQSQARIDIITRYVPGRSGIVGLQLHRENFSIGGSYDFPLFTKNAGNTGAIEVGLEIRRLVDPRLKRKITARKKVASSQKRVLTKKIPERKPVPAAEAASNSSRDSVSVTKKVKRDLKTSLQHKQDSAVAIAEAGNIRHQPLLLEKIILHFNFKFNSSDLDDASMKYLDDLVEALKDNAHLRIKLTGHTDNIGSAKFNQRLSLYRANSIKEYLTGKGISSERIATEGKGMGEPLNENKTEEEMARNRRVELVILYQD